MTEIKIENAMQTATASSEGQGVRADGGKSRVDLIPPEALKLVLGPAYWPFIDWFHGSDPMPEELVRAAIQHAGYEVRLTSDLKGSGPSACMLGIGQIYRMGAAKYAERNWEKGIPFSRMYGPAIRHALWHELGETADRESGEPHLMHWLWGVIGCYTFEQRGMTALDDRPRVAKAGRP